MKGSAPSSGSRAVGSQERTRCRNSSRLSDVFEPVMGGSLGGDEESDLLATLDGIAVGLAVEDDPTEVQVEVVIPRDSDPAVQLDAFLNELGAALSCVGLGDSNHLTGALGAGVDRVCCIDA